MQCQWQLSKLYACTQSRAHESVGEKSSQAWKKASQASPKHNCFPRTQLRHRLTLQQVEQPDHLDSQTGQISSSRPSNCGKQTAVAPEKQCLLQGLSVVPAMQMFGIHSRKQNSRTQANHSGIQAGPGVRSLPRLNHLTFQGDVPTAQWTSAHIKSAPQPPEALEEEAPRPSAKMESSSLAPSG